MDPIQFIATIGPLAQQQMQQHGILASLTIAQACLESGYGTNELTEKANNLFSIKGTGPAGSYTIKANEYDSAGKEYFTQAAFRKYTSWEESVQDHTDLLLESRYANLVGELNHAAAAQKIYADEYATDPKYTNELIALYNQYNLESWNKSEEGNKVGKILVLDAGHGGIDPGATGMNGLVEKTLTLQIVYKVRDYIVNNFNDCQIHLTRDSDVYVGLSDRAKIANDLNADLFVSFHHNSGGGSGFESHVYLNQRDKKAGEFQDIVHGSIMEFMVKNYMADRGKKESNFAVVRETSMPAMLLENLFVDTASDASLLANTLFIDGLSVAAAKGIAKALELEPKNKEELENLKGKIAATPVPTVHWAKGSNDYLMKLGILTSDHTLKLDAAATEGMVIAIAAKLAAMIDDNKGVK